MMLTVKVTILTLFLIFLLILQKKAQWKKGKGLIFGCAVTIYLLFILKLNPLGGLINLFSLLFFTLEMFHILNVSNDLTEIDNSPEDSGSFAPKVSIHVPICKEPVEVVAKTLHALNQLDYPDYEVCVILNNSNERTLLLALSEICAKLGERFRLIYLPHVKGYKAGALNYALKVTDPEAEIIAVVDADYIVERDFLRKTVKYFKDPDIAIVQTPQDYRDFPLTSFFEGMYYAYRYFFSIVMNSCNKYNAVSFMGTMGLVRKRHLEEAGGWCEEVVTEDSELGFRIHEKKYRTVYIDHSFGKGLMPLSFSAYKKQRFRWAFGNMQTIIKNLNLLLKGKLTMMQRMCYLGSNTIWFNNLLIPFLIALYGIMFDLSDATATALLGPFIAFFLSRGYGFIGVLPKMLNIPVHKGIYALFAFLAITFPMATAWLYCLIKPEIEFFRTPKNIIKTPLLNRFKEIGPELLMISLSLLMAVVAFLKGKFILGMIMAFNLFIYLSSLWSFKNFIALELLYIRRNKDRFRHDNWYSFSAVETSAS